jgi:hypothetical protein
MQIVLKRKEFTEQSTIGEIWVDGKLECLCIEDKDRGLTKDMPLAEVKAKKVYAKTAIPKGTYQVILSFSNRFQKYLPELLEVPGFAGIRIHAGNTADDSEGCILPGKIKGTNRVAESRVAFNALFAKMKAVEKKEKIWITIQ